MAIGIEGCENYYYIGRGRADGALYRNYPGEVEAENRTRDAIEKVWNSDELLFQRSFP